jgi:hypothetical protein
VNKLIKNIAIFVFLGIVFSADISKIYSSDAGVVPTILDLSDYLSYKYKGFDIGIKSLRVGETFDDNVAFSKENKINDFITDVGFTVGVNYTGKRRSLSLTSLIINHTYAENSVYDNVSEDLNFGFTNEFSEYDRVSLSNIFSHTEAPLFSDTNFNSDQFGRPNGRWEYFKNRLNFNYSRDINKQLSASIRYANTLDYYSGINIPGSSSNKPGIVMNYIFTPFTSFSLSYDYFDVQFDNNRDAAQHEIAANVIKNITKKISVSMSGGVDFIRSFNDEELTKPLFSASIGYEKDANTRMGVSFYKHYGVTPYIADLFDQWNTSASLSRQISERLNYNLSIFYGVGKYVTAGTEQTLKGVTSTFTYDIYKNLFGNFTYSYTDSDYNNSFNGYTRNTFYLGLSAAF